MKKLFYIILVVAILFVLGFVAKQYLSNQEPEIVVVEEVLPPIPEESVEIEAIENEAIDVIETNPEETADEGETEIEVNDEEIVESNPEATADEGETVVE